MEVEGDSKCPNSYMDQSAIPMKIPSPNMTGKRASYRNLQWETQLEGMNSFVYLSEGKLFSLHWDPIVLLQAEPVETPEIQHTILKEGRKWKFCLVYPVPNPSSHL